MAPINILLIIVAVTLTFVENAPSNIVRTNSKDEELRTRLVFIDRDADDAINSNSNIEADAISPDPFYQSTQKTGSTISKHFAKSEDKNPPLEVKASEPSGLLGMDDERRIWGIAVDDTDLIEDESYYNRPLALPKTIVKIPSQPKTHVVSEVIKVTSVPKPSACDMSIVICCQNPSILKECFISQGCNNVTDDMFPYLCSSDSINKIIQELGKFYKGR